MRMMREWQKQRKILKTLAWFLWSCYSNRTEDTPGYQFAHTNTPFFLMICSRLHFCVESLVISRLTFPLFPFSYHLCVLGFVNISPLNLSVNFDRGIFWADSKRGKCKALHPLLNNIATWEASMRYLHFMASVGPFGKQSYPKLVDAEGANWQVLTLYCYAKRFFFFCI